MAEPPVWVPGGEAGVVQVLRDTPDSAVVVEQVVQALQALPDSLKAEMFRRGLSVMVVPNIPEYVPKIAAQIPRGYTSGDYRFAHAIYDPRKNRLVVAERVARGPSAEVKVNKLGIDATFHELGHAIDYAQGMVSAQPDFIAAYEEDKRHLTPKQVAKDQYFLQPGKAGPAELFAELLSIHYLWRMKSPMIFGHLVRDFPVSYAYVEGYLTHYESAKPKGERGVGDQ